MGLFWLITVHLSGEADVHSHYEGLLVLIRKPGRHLQVAMATVIRTTGLLDVDLIEEEATCQSEA